MEDGTVNSIGQKPRGFRQTADCEFHLRSLFSGYPRPTGEYIFFMYSMYCTVYSYFPMGNFFLVHLF
jgi:hypothetical protein